LTKLDLSFFTINRCTHYKVSFSAYFVAPSGRLEGLGGPLENGVITTGQFLATVTLGGSYYFVPPIPNKNIANIGQQFFD
jgi:hypothetical protein